MRDFSSKEAKSLSKHSISQATEKLLAVVEASSHTVYQSQREIHSWKQPKCPSAEEWIKKLWYIYTMDYYSAIKKNTFKSVLMRWVKLEPVKQSEVSKKEKHKYSILTHIHGI